MKLVLPTILTLCCAAVLFLLDPTRQRGSMIDPGSLAPSAMPERVGPWVRLDSDETLPHAYPPHNLVWERVTTYQPASTESGDAAFVHVIIAQDRRDLLAYEPSYAMRAGGWSSESAETTDGLNASQHSRREGLLKETLTIETAYILPGVWGPDRSIIDDAHPHGSGWPGPGAMVQLLTSSPLVQDPSSLRDLVKNTAAELAAAMDSGQAP